MATDGTCAVSLRRLRKRDADRKFQRRNRERTKSRLQHLESLAEQLRHQDVTGYVDVLMKHISEIEKQRDEYKQKVEAIESILTDGARTKPSKLTSISVQPSAPCLGQLGSLNGHASTSSSKPLASECLPTVAAAPRPILVAETDLPTADDLEFAAPCSSTPLATDSADIIGRDSVAIDPKRISAIETKVLQQPQACQCQSGYSSAPNFLHKWTVANQRLSDWMHDPAQYRISSTSRDRELWFDTPIRGVVDGWSSVERRGSFHPAWRLLRSIDEIIFEPFCDLAERVAVMYIMGLLLASHIHPGSTDLVSQLPSYYQQHVIQQEAAPIHSYAIGYLAWPGLRAKFIASEHRYCSNKFWDLLVHGLKVQLPHALRDCYSQRVETGLYHPRPAFVEAIMDIKRWTMGPDMFGTFPELWGAIPAHGTIPRTLTITEYPLEDDGSKQRPFSLTTSANGTSYREDAFSSKSGSLSVPKWRQNPEYAMLFESNFNPHISQYPNSGVDGLISLLDGSIDW